jgi:biopolymer transport protein ExbD
MLTTTFVLAPGMQVDLPQGRSSQRTSENDAVVIITQDGTVYYDDAHVDIPTLQVALQRALHVRPGLRIIIQADKSAQHGRVVEVMDTAKAVGIERLAIATAPKKTLQ